MFIPKKYGQSKVDACPFCQKQATTLNRQSVPVCQSHKEEALDDLKCLCGSTLEILNGKFGVFFSCMKCGNMNLRKVLEFNTVKPKENEYQSKNNNQIKYPASSKDTNSTRKEIIVRSDDPRYFD